MLLKLLALSLFAQVGTNTTYPAPSLDIDTPVLAVTGIGRSPVGMDASEYIIILYADVENGDESAAKETASQLRKEIIKTVKEAGGTEDDVVLTSSSTSPPIEGDAYYRITQDIKVTLKNVKDIDKAKEKFMLTTGIQLGSVTPVIEKTLDYQSTISEARKQAVKDAREAARELAAEIGVLVGEPLYITESISYPYYSGYEAAASEITVTVVIYYGIIHKK